MMRSRVGARRAAGGLLVSAAMVGGLLAGTGVAAARDNLAGKPCTDQSGAPGHYIWAGNMWVCQITGNAPRVNPPKPRPMPAPKPAPPLGIFGS